MELSTAHLRPAPSPAAVNLVDQPPTLAAARAVAGDGLLTPQLDETHPTTAVELSPGGLSAAPSTARLSPSAMSSPEKGGGATPTPAAVAAAPAVGNMDDIAAPPVEELSSSDVRRHAAQTALDLAVVHALVSAGSDDKARKFGSTVLVVGGGALISGLGSATASRVQARLGRDYPALVAGGWEVGVVPAPREVDPRLLVWKGTSVFARLESVNETWVSKGEWEQTGMRAVKDRSLFL